MWCAASHSSRAACHRALSSGVAPLGGVGSARLARKASMSIASVPEHALALLVDDLAPLHDGKVVGALRRGVGVGAHEAVLPGLAVDLLADKAGRQPMPALGVGVRMHSEALVHHRLAFLARSLGPGRPDP